MHTEAELLAKLNTEESHRLYWSGRADVSVYPDRKVVAHARRGLHNRIYSIMESLGYRLVDEEEVDMGDDDCHKREIFTAWLPMSSGRSPHAARPFNQEKEVF